MSYCSWTPECCCARDPKSWDTHASSNLSLATQAAAKDLHGLSATPQKKKTQILYLRFLNMKQTPRNGSAMLWIGSSWCSKPNNLHFWRLHITHLFLVIEEYGIGCTSVPAKSPFRPGSRPLLSFERGISRWSKRITPKWLRPPHWSCGDGWDGWKPMEIYGFVAPPLKKKNVFLG